MHSLRLVLSLTILVLLTTRGVMSRADEDAAQGARPARMAEQALLLGAVRAGSRIVAVGEHGIIMLSDDEGRHWRQAERVPTITTLTAVSFVDALHGWAVGHGAQILATSDGGEHWELRAGKITDEDSLFSVWFRDREYGLAVGPYGYAVTTADGGLHWQRIHLAAGDDAERHLNGIFADTKGTVGVAAEAGHAFISTDGGVTWQVHTVPYNGSLWGGLVCHDGSLVLWGMAGHAFISHDRGTTWTALATDSDQSLTAGAERPDGSVVFVGLGGNVSYSDPALNFKSITRETRQLATAVVLVPQGVLIFGQGGTTRMGWPPQVP
ncbi:MAG: glycosyl hydrolase [Gammaproteobacteria bacterium]|nr:glycosyl hydrolase [Gammaproteobacteria bacterium]